MKTFNGKAIYNPSGKAGEYAEWACNFYTGCSNNCSYCYLKKGVLSHMWSTTPQLKKCFKDENHALEIFEKELRANLPELQKHGLLFSFTTDPMLEKTKWLTINAIKRCFWNNVHCTILTKCAFSTFGMWFPNKERFMSVEDLFSENKNLISFGFTLTGHDELELNASTNAERIEAMRKLHDFGFKTWASIEPVIDIQSSFNMIFATAGFCDLYKVGLMSGGKYTKNELLWLIEECRKIANVYKEYNFIPKFYFNDSLLKQAGISRENLPANCVGRDYDMFNN